MLLSNTFLHNQLDYNAWLGRLHIYHLRTYPPASKTIITPGTRAWLNMAASLFDRLPAELILPIVKRCTIFDLHSLRLTSRALCEVIATHIAVIAPAVAQRTFPRARRLLRRPPQYTLKWLNDLIPLQLAAIVVDRYRYSHLLWQQLDRFGIPAEDEDGDELRLRVAHGWRILKRLSDISKEVYSLPEEHLPPPPPPPRARGGVTEAKKMLKRLFPLTRSSNGRQTARDEVPESVVRRECLVLQRRKDFTRTRTRLDRADLHLMLRLLYAAFRADQYLGSFTCGFGPRPPRCGPNFFDWAGEDEMRLFSKKSWVHWFILHEGPSLFLAQWTMSDDGPRPIVRDRLLQAWADRKSQEQRISLETDSAWEVLQVWEAVPQPLSGVGILPDDPFPYIEQYAEVKVRRRKNSGIEPAPEETMDDMLYFIDLWETGGTWVFPNSSPG